MFKTADLIASAEEEIVRRKAEVDEYNRDQESNLAAARDRHARQQAPHWAAFAQRIRLRGRQQKPVTLEDVPEELLRDDWSAELKVWKRGDHVPRVARVAELEQLILLLKAVTEETVSAAALERFGFKIKDLFRGDS